MAKISHFQKNEREFVGSRLLCRKYLGSSQGRGEVLQMEAYSARRKSIGNSKISKLLVPLDLVIQYGG